VWDTARRRPQHVLERLAALVTPMFSLDDLVLAEEAEAKLRELVAHVALQHVVLDEWGFRRRLPRGQGVAALFAGPPGTGKTTAAEALARELGQDLYRIDLSAVVSKYVGETEKNLALAFDEAERGSAVLFFDEADALFGRRTEVRDAHDRYANLEVNYLLQRVETFTGLVVLASNRRSALDEAFLRRLRFVIRFDAPDAALRRRLWERAFPDRARVGDLDWDALAAAELAGGSIQSAALAAAYLAAGDGGVITRRHVEHALLREHQKLGKAWPGMPLGATA
jgi:SpoVK/Ycf46/Vps4 family AAA+-type ATPase